MERTGGVSLLIENRTPNTIRLSILLLFRVSLFLLLPSETKVHTTVSEKPNRKNPGTNKFRIIRRMEYLVRIQMLYIDADVDANVVFDVVVVVGRTYV